MRNQRAAAYARAATRAAEVPAGTRWSTLTADPNDPITIALRARVLRAAFRPPVRDRIGYLTERCRGRTVLDIGAVAHAAECMDSPTWLHGRLAAVAGSCLAVDILPEGVVAMRERGYDAIVHDLTTGAGPVRARGPFDVVVAGGLIEHVPDLLLLAEAFTVLNGRPDSSARGLAKRALRRMRGSNWQPTGLVTGSGRMTTRIRTDTALGRPRRDWFRGETFVYVIRRPATAS